MKKYGVNFNVGIDPQKEIWDKYATGAIPKSFLIDQNGIIKYIIKRSQLVLICRYSYYTDKYYGTLHIRTK